MGKCRITSKIAYYLFFLFLLAGCKNEEVVWEWDSFHGGLEGYPGEILINEHTVYLGGDDKYFYAIDQGTGKTLWNFDSRTMSPYKPIIYQDMIIVGAYGGGVFGVDQRGNQVWKFRPQETTTSQPIIHEDKLYIVEPSNKLHVLNPLTGESLNVLRGYANKADFIVSGNIMFATDWSENRVIAIDLQTGEEVWISDQITSMPSTIELIDGILYLLSDTDDMEAKKLSAIHAESGSLLWSEPLKGMFYTTPAFTEDSFYYSVNGMLYQFSLDEKKEVWSKETSIEYVNFQFDAKNKLLYYKDCDRRILAMDEETKEIKWSYEHNKDFSQFQVTKENIFLKHTNSLTMIKSQFKFNEGVDQFRDQEEAMSPKDITDSGETETRHNDKKIYETIKVKELDANIRFKHTLLDKGDEYRVFIYSSNENKRISDQTQGNETQGDEIYSGDYRIAVQLNDEENVMVTNITLDSYMFNMTLNPVTLLDGKTDILSIVSLDDESGLKGELFFIKDKQLTRVKNSEEIGTVFVKENIKYIEDEDYYQYAYMGHGVGGFYFSNIKLDVGNKMINIEEVVFGGMDDNRDELGQQLYQQWMEDTSFILTRDMY
ncbi:outer membrane protein assembly factor BamB family protein [Sutcliffiella halmapala]|uniref:outer membrane protein assembly factor BamB family protein n=1 Tax=Sutcliffiella halmapala TaxID=79882 RepID=UPI000995B84B|nr:PQQ-binding-like beta-propeller repeat protein [Sutcliffiella halmapala]